MLNAADAMKTCKNMKRMIKTQVLETLKRKCKRERLEKRGDKVSTFTLSKYAKTP